MDTEFGLTGGELNTISVDDANSISYTIPIDVAGHHLRLAITETPADVTQIDVTVKGYGDHVLDEHNDYELYIWDDDGSAWEKLDDHQSDVKATLTGTISADLTNYIHNIAGTNYVDILAMGTDHGVPGNNFVYTYYAELVITSGPTSFVPYMILI
jgi:hypothetical protein